MSTIIPETIPLFNTWIRNTNARQLAINTATTNPYWQDYTWTLAQSNTYKTDWHDKWVNDLFPKWSDPLLKTKEVNQNVETFMKDFAQFVQNEKLVDKIKSSGIATNADALTWNFVLVRSEPTVQTDPIDKDLFAEVVAGGRGAIEVEVRAEEDQSRPSIPTDAGADSVQYAWKVFATKEETANPNLTPEEMTRDISTKARFEFDAGFANQGKWLVIYFRWYNTKRPNLAGQWSAMTTLAIS
jgi:hypothetical protein